MQLSYPVKQFYLPLVPPPSGPYPNLVCTLTFPAYTTLIFLHSQFIPTSFWREKKAWEIDVCDICQYEGLGTTCIPKL